MKTNAKKTGMVDVGDKPATMREAIAFGEIRINPKIIAILKKGELPKGDVFSTARFAGIMAAKKVDQLIPLCHTIPLDVVEISFSSKEKSVIVRGRVKATGKTGVEMEALTAVGAALLTIYDMCKAMDKEMVIAEIYLAKKSGGRSGDYIREGIPIEWL